jgi:glycine betaine/choline ABC-type transport system substrate-binding protein
MTATFLPARRDFPYCASLQKQFGLEVLPSLGFDNTVAMVMRGSDARRLRLKTLSDAAAASSQLRLGVGYEFLERPDGYKGLVSKYGLKFGEAPRVMDLGVLYRALKTTRSTWWQVRTLTGLSRLLTWSCSKTTSTIFLRMMRCQIVRRQTLKRHPEVAALQRLSSSIGAEEMRRLNYAVDGEKKDAAMVVKDFLARKYPS